MTDQDRIKLEAELAEAQAENARLAAGLWNVRDALSRDRTAVAVALLANLLNRNDTALDDLLKEPLEFLEGLEHRDHLTIDSRERLHRLIARLRALVESKP